MSSADCLEVIRKSFKGTKALSLQDTDILLSEVMDRVDILTDPDPDWAFVAREVTKLFKHEAAYTKRAARINALKREDMLAMGDFAAEKYGKPGWGLTALMAGANMTLPGGRKSTEAIHISLRNEYQQALMSKIEKEDLLVFFNDDSNGLPIMLAWEKLTNPSAEGTTSKEAMRIAEIVEETFSAMHAENTAAGGNIQKIPGWTGGQIYDSRLVEKATDEEYLAFMEPHVDPRTFERSGAEKETLEAASDQALHDFQAARVKARQVRTLATRVAHRMGMMEDVQTRADAAAQKLEGADAAIGREADQIFERLGTIGDRTPESMAEVQRSISRLRSRAAALAEQSASAEGRAGGETLAAVNNALTALEGHVQRTGSKSGKNAAAALRKDRRALSSVIETAKRTETRTTGGAAEVTRELKALTKRMDNLDTLTPADMKELSLRLSKIAQRRDVLDEHKAKANLRGERAADEFDDLAGAMDELDELSGKLSQVVDDTVAARKLIDKRAAGTPGRVRNQRQFMLEAKKSMGSGYYSRTNSTEDTLTFHSEGGNLARRAQAHRVMHYKGARSWFAVQQKFGAHRTIRETIAAGIDSMTRDTAFYMTMGTNPEANLRAVKEDLLKKYGKDKKMANSLTSWRVDAFLAQVDGSASIPHNNDLAFWAQWVRNIETMAKLGGAAISSITDISNQALTIRNTTGTDFMSALGQAFSNVAEGFSTSAEMRQFAELMGTAGDSIFGDMSAKRFSVADGQRPAGAALLRTYFKLNLLSQWTDANKRGLGMMMSRWLAMNADKDFAKLDNHMRYTLEQSGIGPKEWAVARKAVVKAPDGREYLMPHLIKEMDDSVFKAEGLTPHLSRNEISVAIRAFYTDAMETGVPTGGARERAMLTWGLAPGTVPGEAMRMFTQFKMFPTTILTKGVSRSLYSNPSGKADIVGLVSFAASATAMGYVAWNAKQVALGREPFIPHDGESFVKALTQSMVQGGGAGILGDFLFGEWNRYGNSPWATAAGPFGAVAEDVGSIWAKIIRGEEVDSDVFRLFWTNTPGNNLFYTRAVMDYMFIHQINEMLNPGYNRRRATRLRNDENRGYILPSPAAAIPHGGGNRLLEGIR